MKTLAVIWTGLAIVMLTAGIRWKAVILILAASLVLLILVRRMHRSNDGFFWIATIEPPDLKKVKCAECDGCGAFWLDPRRRRWVIIPHNLRRVDASAPYIRTPLANIRSCRCCTGRGFHLVPFRPAVPALADLSVPWGDEPDPEIPDGRSHYDPLS